LREEVRKLIREDKSDSQIKEYLVTRYGDFVLYKPEVKPLTWVLWFGPFLLLVLAIVGMAYYLRQRQSAQNGRSVLSDEDRRKVQEILKSGDKP
jgi:cytochrome c-type biogenesis protein CcmH